MAQCKKCGKQFHACSSCGLLYSYEYDYCSDTCWYSSLEYNINKEIFTLFYIGLTEKQKELFAHILNFNSDYDLKMEKWLMELEKNNTKGEKV